MIFWACNRSKILTDGYSSRLDAHHISQLAPDATITSIKCLYATGNGLNFWEFDVPDQADKNVILALDGLEDCGVQANVITKMDNNTGGTTWQDDGGGKLEAVSQPSA